MVYTILSKISLFFQSQFLWIILWWFLLLIICLIFAWLWSIKLCSIHWHSSHRKRWYFLSWCSMMIWASLLISYFDFWLSAYWICFLLVSFLIWLLYFEAEWRGFVFQPIVFFIFFCCLSGLIWWWSSYFLLTSVADSSYHVFDESMSPTYMPWDVLLTKNALDWFSDISSWDVITFRTQWSDISVKRVIWKSNEIILIKENDIEICTLEPKWCTALDEPYLLWMKTLPLCDKNIFKIEDGLFVLWDNRKDKTDSRCCFDGACHQGEDTLVREDELRGIVVAKIDKKRSLLVSPFLDMFWI